MSEVRYTVRLDARGQHLVHVELRFPSHEAHAELALPAWCPGSYLIRDYARFVRDLEVRDETDAPRAVHKVDKTTWRVASAGARELVVRYAVYGHDLTVRTNHLDDSHAFLHGPATFIYPTHLRAAPITVEIDASDVTTALPRDAAGSYYAAGIDELYDHPIHVGAVRTQVLATKAAHVELAIWGDRAAGGVFSEERLAQDVSAIVDDHVARLGACPFQRYVFIVMLTHDGYGGLEHRASSVNLYHPHFGANRKHYEGLLELLSHELFHAWNGKRIAPGPLLDFDYSKEAYTPCLWVMEGLTSHYDRFALRSSGRITAKSLLDKVLDDWSRLQATPGRARQSLEASSFDAWIKLYKPDESNLNTTVSYYLKGGLAMFALDLQIRRRTDGAKSLDDVLRALWTQFGATGEPHPDDLQPVFEAATGLPLDDVFDRQIRGTDDPELARELAHVGLELRANVDPAQTTDGASAQWLGVTTTGVKVTGVFDGGPAHAAGISPGDELVALDTFRTASEAELRGLVATRRAGDIVRLAVFRRHRLIELAVTLAVAPPTRFEVAAVPDPGPAAARYLAWIGEAHPGASVLASVTATSRWV